MDCTPTCRLPSHASIILSAITCEDLPTFQSIVKRVCSNAANLTDNLGRHAIHVAASCGKTDILEWLVKECKVGVGLRDLESGWTPLHRSLFYGQLTCAVKLLQHGADLYAIDKDDFTPLDLVMLDSPFKLSISVEGRVISNYETKLDDELFLHVGDIITNIHMSGPTYWTGNLKGVRGFFPKECVKLIKQDYRNELYTWGANTNFTLGHQDESLRQNPDLVESLSNDKSISINQVVMCKFHSVFLSQDGRVFTCGHGRGGRLGHGDEQTHLAPKQVKSLMDYRCVSVAAAQDHTVVVTESGFVFTFGLNDMHQLGHTPAPLHCLVPTKIQMKAWKGKHMIGVAAGRFHTVFYTHHEVYTCGLNIGQLGQLKGEKFHTTPRQVTALYHKDIIISMVACSDAATVCATSKGNIFILSQFSCQKVVNRFPELTRLLVTSSDVDLSSNYEAFKVSDHLTVTLLNAKGLVYQWKESFGGMRRCKWLLRKELVVADVAVGKQLYIITDCGEMFTCTKAGGGHPVVKSTQSSPSASPSMLFGDWDKKDVINYNVTRCPMVHRGIKIFTDLKSKGFAVLQVEPSTGLEKRPSIRKSAMCDDFKQLLEESMVEDNIHDVHLVANGQVFPAHSFILASTSPTFRKILIEEQNKLPESESETIKIVKIDDVEDDSILAKYLEDLYSGLQVDDSLLFGLKTNKKPTKKTFKDKPKNLLHVNGVGQETEDFSSLQINYDAFTMPYLDDFSTLSLLEKEDNLEDFSEYTDKTKKNKLKSISESNVNKKAKPDHKSKQGKEDLKTGNVVRGLKFKRTNCPELHDVTIGSEDGINFLCHKCVLVARLDYFRSMLACGWLEASKEMRVLKMPIHSSVLKIVLDCLYTDKAKTIQGHQDIEFVGNVLVIADQLLISRLTEICESAMVKLISLKNAMELLEFSCVYNASQLKASCLEFICSNLSSLLESGSLNLLCDETLEELSKAYRDHIPRMPWRIITPTHDHFFALAPEPFTPPKKRRTSSRKRSVKSESEGETENETSQNEMSENRERKTSETNVESVFEVEGDESKVEEKQDEMGLVEVIEIAEEKFENIVDSEQPSDEGLWYRKKPGKQEQLKSPKPKKQLLKQEKNVMKSAPNSSKPQDIPKATNQDKFSTRCAWGMSNTSATSSPSSGLRAIMEQEQLTSKTHTKEKKSPTSVAQIKIETKGKQSQKQKKKAQLNQQIETRASVEPENKEAKQGTEEPKFKSNPWGLVEKKPTPVRSLRELIQQEEKSQLILPKTQTKISPKTTSKTSDKGTSEKQSSAKRRISWGLPQVEQKETPLENKEPALSPRSAWTSNPSANSPPSPSAVSFADILHLQERENTNLNRAKEKPLNLIQLEDRAIQELLDHYGGQDCACEMITVERIPAATAIPVWNKERTTSIMST